MAKRYAIIGINNRDMGSLVREGDVYEVRAFGRNTTYIRGVRDTSAGLDNLLTHLVSQDLNMRIALEALA